MNGSLNVTTAPVIGTTTMSTFLSARIDVEDLAAARVGDRRTAAVDRVRHAQVRRDQPVVQRLLRLLREIGEAQARRRRACRPCARRCRRRSRTRRRPARFCCFAHAGGVVGPRARERGRHLEQLVEPVDARHAELAEHRGRDRVGTGEVAGVRLRHRLRRPSVLPTFTITIGLRSCAAWSAASISVRPSLKPSM